MGILSILIFLPLPAMLLIAMLPARQASVYRWITLIATLLQLAVLLVYALPFFKLHLFGLALDLPDGDTGISAAYLQQFSLIERLPWLRLDLGSFGHLHIDYFLGADGLSMMLLLLTTLVMPLAALSSWKIDKNPKAYFLLFLLLDLSIIGVFCALDFFLFYIFYELMLVPMFFLIGLWGGPRREYAAIKFFLYTLFGSVFMLLVMVGLFFSFAVPAGPEAGEAVVHNFDMLNMTARLPDGSLANLIPGSIFAPGQSLFGLDARLLAFAVLFIGFAIKIPMVPFHTWLPDAHVEAPTPISVILAGILLKVGGYGIFRICFGLFPEGAQFFSWWIGLFGVISILYGALVAMAQEDLKSLVAYSSVSHMGFVLLGCASLEVTGMMGAAFQLFTHGLISAMLFLLVGVLYERVHDRQIGNFQGLWEQMPRYAFFVMLGFFAALGLPGLCAFVSELMVFAGAFQAPGTTGAIPYWMAAAAIPGIVLGAAYFLRTYRRMFFGRFNPVGSDNWTEKLRDLQLREYLMLVPLAVMLLLFGILPAIVLNWMNGSIAALVKIIQDVSY